jgi:hypothetical protein
MPSVLSHNRFNQLRTSTRTDIYARPDLYDMEYEGASNHDAASSLACSRASVRAACWSSRAGRVA